MSTERRDDEEDQIVKRDLWTFLLPLGLPVAIGRAGLVLVMSSEFFPCDQGMARNMGCVVDPLEHETLS
jgi:hypothetical protein